MRMRSGRLSVALLETELDGNDHPVTYGRERLADHFLVGRAAGFGGVEESHATVEGLTSELDARGPIHCGAVAVAQAHAPEAES